VVRQITHIIIHCSASRADQNLTAADIEKMHRERGFIKIGYHWVIRRDGTLERGRDEKEAGAHAVGWNTKSIGICMIGGVNQRGQGEANFTDEQFAALDGLLKTLKSRYPDAKVIGHRDTGAKKDCPSFDVAHWLETGELINPRNI
jgi:N-acetyl-anhydromuramyl-L-alanine amidase AmpD